MRIVVQRVKNANVKIANKIVGKISKGLLVLLAVHADDTFKDVEWMVNKVINLRIFNDDSGKLNKSVQDVNGSILVVSQFTLYGDCAKGNRPSFIKSAEPVKAKDYYEKFVNNLRDYKSLQIATGIFQEHLEVSLINDGPTTIIIDSSFT